LNCVNNIGGYENVDWATLTGSRNDVGEHADSLINNCFSSCATIAEETGNVQKVPAQRQKQCHAHGLNMKKCTGHTSCE
jgi:hypothetical protein